MSRPYAGGERPPRAGTGEGTQTGATGMTARQAAFTALSNSRRNGIFLEDAFAQINLPPQEAALAARLCYGVMQNRMLLDDAIDKLANAPSRIEPQIRDILCLGLYQIWFMDRVPVHAAVSETVRMAEETRPHAKNFVNAILRKASTRARPQPEDISIRYSHPKWILERFAAQYGSEQAEAFARANNEIPPVYAIRNPLYSDVAELVGESFPGLENCVALSKPGAVKEIPGFAKGAFLIADPAALLAVMAGTPQAGETVLDGCAAPGGKSFLCAMQMQDKGQVIACDLKKEKLAKIQEGAKRLGLSIVKSEQADAGVFKQSFEQKADLVIVDAPCSGLGVIRKKPDIRNKSEAEIAELPAKQLAFLENLSRYVKPGGRLLYVTCTVLREENEEVCRAFLAGHTAGGTRPVFVLKPFTLPIGGQTEGMLQLLPHVHGTDGFFIALMERKS